MFLGKDASKLDLNETQMSIALENLKQKFIREKTLEVESGYYELCFVGYMIDN